MRPVGVACLERLAGVERLVALFPQMEMIELLLILGLDRHHRAIDCKWQL